MNELISIIIPVYNVEKHLDRCISSIVGQTYENLEIILIDDGSVDSSLDICNRYKYTDSRIKVIHQENQGQSVARNNGIDLATGEFIVFVDSDDWISENYIEILYKTLKAEDADVSIVDMHITDGNSFRSIDKNGTQYKVFDAKQAIEVLMLQKEFDTGPHCKLYKKNLFINNRFKDGIIYEDLDLIYRVFFDCKKIVYSNKAQYFYFDNSNGTMNESMSDRHLVILDVSKNMVNNITKRYPDLKYAAYRRYVSSLFIILEKIHYCKAKKKYKQTIKDIKTIVKNNKKNIFNNPYIRKFSKIKLRALLIGFFFYSSLVSLKDIAVGVRK